MTDSPGSNHSGAIVTYSAQRISPSGLGWASAALRKPQPSGTQRRSRQPRAKLRVFFMVEASVPRWGRGDPARTSPRRQTRFRSRPFPSAGCHAIASARYAWEKTMIGASHHRIGGDRLAVGAGRFVADVRVPGMLHAVVLRSRHAHARLVSVDAKRALELAGVRAVLTAADAPLAAAAVVIRERFTYPRQTAAALETRGLVAVPPDPKGGELHLIGSTKCIHINRGILAPIFGIPLGALRLTEVDVGGGFGVRGELYPEDILVPLAAMKLGRPVRWIESRRENLMAANHAREVEYDVEIGFDGDGHILAIRALIRADIGAYVRTAALVPAEFGAALLPGPYRVRNYACDLWSVVTNKTPAGTLRSPGRPECNVVRARLLDAGP